MSSTGKRPSGDVAETLRTLTDGFATLARGFEPIQRVLGELSATLEPLRQTLGSLAIAAAPFVQAVARGMERWDSADRLLARGWVPHHTTPFDLVADCGNDDARLQASLLAYYTNHWAEVRARLETRLSSHGIDAEAKATFREALDAHEAGFYRCVIRVLFPELERVFRAALFDGRAGPIPYNEFVRRLSGEASNLELADFLIAGIQDMVLFKYLTEGVREASASRDDLRKDKPEYAPGLAVGVDETNVETARRSPIPTRHAVAHGLVTYTSRQSSLNAIFIADYVFGVVTQVLRRSSNPATPDVQYQSQPGAS